MPFDIPGALGAGYSAQDITGFLSQNPGQVPFDVSGALKAGYSPEDIVDHLNPNVARPSEQGVSILAPINRGIAHAQEGVANLAQDLGFTGAASDLRSRIPQADLDAQQSSTALAQDLKAGKLGTALGDLPSATLEQVLPVAAGVASAPLGGAPAVAAAGGIYSAATQGDAIARQRAANNGDATPTAADLTIGLGGGAALGAVGSAGLGGVGEGLATAGTNVVKHALADAAQPELASLAGSVGTTAGAQNASPSDVTAAMLMGAATRAGLGLTDAFKAGYDATPDGKADAAAKQYSAMTPADQQNVQNLAGAHSVLQAEMNGAVPMPGETRIQAAARTAAGRLVGDVGDMVNTLEQQGHLDAGDAQPILDAVGNARNQQRVLGQEDLDGINKIGLDPATTDALKNTITQIGMLSDAGVANRGSAGLLDAAGKFLGGKVGFGTGLVIGMPGIGAKLGVAAGSALGGKLADVLGVRQPQLIKDAQPALAMLNASGLPVPNTRAQLLDAVSMQQAVMATQRRLMGLAPSEAVQLQTTAPQGIPQASPGPVPMPNMDPVVQSAMQRAAANAVVQPQGGPQAAADPIAAAQARVQAQGLSGPSQGASALGGDFGMSPGAAQQAARLPDWVYAHGAGLVNALAASGKAQPVNMAGEANTSLASLVAKGFLKPDEAAALQGHRGRVVWPVFNLIRNETLLRHGIDRTWRPEAAGQPVMAQAAE